MRENPFKLSARNSLKTYEVPIVNEKNLLLTMKGASDLRTQIEKNERKSKQLLMKTLPPKVFLREQKQLQKHQVTALDNFKVIAVRQQSKDLIQSIQIRRRQKHLDAYHNFQQNLDSYKQNLLSIYRSIADDTVQVCELKQSEINLYLDSLSRDVLLKRDKQVLKDIKSEVEQFKERTMVKLAQSEKQFARIKQSRGNIAEKTCSTLKDELIEIAFILQPEAMEIYQREKQSVLKFEEEAYNEQIKIINQLKERQDVLMGEVDKRSQEIKKSWKQIHQDKEIGEYLKESDERELRFPLIIAAKYKQLTKIQQANSKRKMNLFVNLTKQDPQILTKATNDKWMEHLKIINEAFDTDLDAIVKSLIKGNELCHTNNDQRYRKLKEKLNYIENRNEEQNQILLKEKCEIILIRNKQFLVQLVKKSTDYAQKMDDKQNQAFKKLNEFILKIALKNDEFSKQFLGLSQKYQLEKAKILDDDDQLVQKLNGELQKLKKQLKQALHHIKLQEIEKACFQKIDEIQKTYRSTHDKNKSLIATHPRTLEDYLTKYVGKIAQIFQLFDQTRRNELVERNKKQAQDIVLKQIQEQQRKKAQEQNLMNQQIKKKGGKAPAAKPKDPKKAATELQQRKKVLLTQIGIKPIQQFSMSSGLVWLVYRTLQQICHQFYTQKQEQQIAPVKDPYNEDAVSTNALIGFSQMATQLLILRNRIFESIDSKKQRVLTTAESFDKETLNQSLQILDQRLKKHYSLKGELEADIFFKRSGEITSHKKIYQKYARSVKEKMDLQTQKFNILLENSLQSLKKHTVAQKAVRQQLSQGNTLSQFQNLNTKNRENFNCFGQQMKQQWQQMDKLCNSQVNAILQKSQQFITKANTNEYSASQLEWYREMMSQIIKQVNQQKIKRTQKYTQIKEHAQKKRKQLNDNFQKDYAACIEELAAKEGTGKKYGRPKRSAQQKLRLQMNKCEQAQINIDQQIKSIQQICEKGKLAPERLPPTLNWRKQLMTVQTCIRRYVRHLDGLVPAALTRPNYRPNYNQSLPQTTLQNAEQDQQKINKEITELGPLSEQKEEKTFLKCVDDIQKAICDEARTIYVGDKAKYITGVDKIPDFLRNYIVNMKKNVEQFRQNSNIQLRQSCLKIADLSEKLAQLFFQSLNFHFSYRQQINQEQTIKKLTECKQKYTDDKNQNLRLLRPNLAHPKCQQQLKTLDQKQKSRSQQFNSQLTALKKSFQSVHFEIGSVFLTTILNNFQFLILYIDSLYLFQDFKKLVGDDQTEVTHLDMRKLMLMKQKGITIDSKSERNIRKKWESINYTLFNFDDYKYVYIAKATQEKQKDPKKGAKKQTKDPKKPVQEPVVSNPNCSKSIQTFKTWRQKSVFVSRQKAIEQFSQKYIQFTKNIQQMFGENFKQNQSFKLKWASIAKELYV